MHFSRNWAGEALHTWKSFLARTHLSLTKSVNIPVGVWPGGDYGAWDGMARVPDQAKSSAVEIANRIAIGKKWQNHNNHRVVRVRKIIISYLERSSIAIASTTTASFCHMSSCMVGRLPWGHQRTIKWFFPHILLFSLHICICIHPRNPPQLLLSRSSQPACLPAQIERNKVTTIKPIKFQWNKLPDPQNHRTHTDNNPVTRVSLVLIASTGDLHQAAGRAMHPTTNWLTYPTNQPTVVVEVVIFCQHLYRMPRS